MTEDTELLMCRIEEMRYHQKQYAKTKMDHNKSMATACERQVDQLLINLRRKGYDPDKFRHKPQQTKLL